MSRIQPGREVWAAGAESIPRRWCLDGLKVIIVKAQIVGRLRPKGKLRQVGTS